MNLADQNDDDLRVALERDTDGSLAYELISNLTQQAARWQAIAASTKSEAEREDMTRLAQTYSTATHVLDTLAPRLRRR
jgi:hypothetical protein